MSRSSDRITELGVYHGNCEKLHSVPRPRRGEESEEIRGGGQEERRRGRRSLKLCAIQRGCRELAVEGPSGSVSRKLDLIAGYRRRYPVSTNARSPRLGVVGNAL